MKIQILLLSAISILFINACTSTNTGFTKPGTNQATATKDAKTCDYDVEKAVITIENPYTRNFARTDLWKQCMNAKGYTKTQ